MKINENNNRNSLINKDVCSYKFKDFINNNIKKENNT